MTDRSHHVMTHSRSSELCVWRCSAFLTKPGGYAVSGVVARPPVPLDVVSGRVGMVERSGRGRGALHQCSAVVDFGESRVVSCRVGHLREGGVRGVGVEVAGVAWSEGRWRVFVGGEGRPPPNGVESILSFRVVGGGALKMSKIGWRCRRSESSQGRSSGIDG